MKRHASRIVLTPSATVLAIDPGFDALPLLRSLSPDFEVRKAPLPGFTRPRFLRQKRAGIGASRESLSQLDTASAWDLHRRPLDKRPACSGEATRLDLKIELANRLLRRCTLCARRCEVDRVAGEFGACRLGPDAWVAEHFVHIAEEAPINPSLVLNLHGCALRCRYCQQHAILSRTLPSSVSLEPSLWKQLECEGARSLSFVGGNPDESLPAILGFLNGAPDGWALPIVWNNHAYSTPEVLQLLEGVADAYIPDLKYGTEECARRLSRVADYPATAIAAIAAMLQQRVPVVVRMLALPSHSECCHLPSLRALASLPGRERLLLSLRGHYVPDWKIGERDGPLAGHVDSAELASLRNEASRLGLSVLD